MEIVKIGEKTWRNVVFHQIRQNFSLPMFFTVWYYALEQCSRFLPIMLHKFYISSIQLIN